MDCKFCNKPVSPGQITRFDEKRIAHFSCIREDQAKRNPKRFEKIEAWMRELTK